MRQLAVAVPLKSHGLAAVAATHAGYHRDGRRRHRLRRLSPLGRPAPAYVRFGRFAPADDAYAPYRRFSTAVIGPVHVNVSLTAIRQPTSRRYPARRRDLSGRARPAVARQPAESRRSRLRGCWAPVRSSLSCRPLTSPRVNVTAQTYTHKSTERDAARRIPELIFKRPESS